MRKHNTYGVDEWVGFEQEYTLYKNDRPLGFNKWRTNPQGDYYCGRNIGDNVSREHLNTCIKGRY